MRESAAKFELLKQLCLASHVSFLFWPRVGLAFPFCGRGPKLPSVAACFCHDTAKHCCRFWLEHLPCYFALLPFAYPFCSAGLCLGPRSSFLSWLLFARGDEQVFLSASHVRSEACSSGSPAQQRAVALVVLLEAKCNGTSS